MIRINTVEYGWETNQTTVSGSDFFSSSYKKVTIAETSSRTFVCADLHLYMRDGISGTTIGNAAYRTASFGVWIDGNYTTQSIYANTANGVATTGDHFCQKFVVNFKNHFSTYFTASSHDVNWSFQTPTGSLSMPFTNHAGKIILTYQYDDTNLTTGTKTVRVPLNSHIGYMSNTLPEMFGSTTSTYKNIPALDNWLPETSKQYKDLFFEIHSKDAASNAVEAIMSLQLDSGSLVPRCQFSSSLNTSVYSYDIYNVSGTLDTATTHSLKAQSSRASRFVTATPILYTTYTYNVGSSRILNSLLVGANQAGSLTNELFNVSPGALASRHHYSVDWFINESNPVLRQSALLGYLNLAASITLTYQFPPTSHRIYTITAGSIESGPFIHSILFDSSSTWNDNYSISRGQNKFSFQYIQNSNNATFNVPEHIGIVNYESDNIGIGNHNKTIYLSHTHSYTIAQVYVAVYINNTNNIHSDVSSSYYLSSISRIHTWNGGRANISTVIFNYTGSLGSASFNANLTTAGDQELGIVETPLELSCITKRFITTKEVDPKLNYFVSKSITSFVGQAVAANAAFSVYDYIAMSNGNYPISCSLINCNYTSSIYDVYFYLSGSYESPINKLCLSQTSSMNKSGSFLWHDNFRNIYAVCYKPEFGISNMLTANSGTHTINFAAPTGSVTSGEHSYVFIG